MTQTHEKVQKLIQSETLKSEKRSELYRLESKKECEQLTMKLNYMIENPKVYDSGLSGVPPKQGVWIFRDDDKNYHYRCPEFTQLVDETNKTGGPITVRFDSEYYGTVNNVRTHVNRYNKTIEYHFWNYRPLKNNIST
jgi:hypothetical protein